MHTQISRAAIGRGSFASALAFLGSLPSVSMGDTRMVAFHFCVAPSIVSVGILQHRRACRRAWLLANWWAVEA